jgi:hypothetical protein
MKSTQTKPSIVFCVRANPHRKLAPEVVPKSASRKLEVPKSKSALS